MNRRYLTKSLALTVAVLTVTSTAHAEPSYLYNRSAFETAPALTNFSYEGLESQAAGATALSPSPLTLSFGVLTADQHSVTGKVGSGCQAGDTACFGRYNTTAPTSTTPEPNKWWESGMNFTLVFNNPVHAFGFSLIDFGDFGSTLMLDLQLSGGGTLSKQIKATSGASSGSLQFFGFIDPIDSYTSVVFRITQPPDEFSDKPIPIGDYDILGFDDLTIADLRPNSNQIPEPATLMLAGLGLLGLAATRRKQRH